MDTLSPAQQILFSEMFVVGASPIPIVPTELARTTHFYADVNGRATPAEVLVIGVLLCVQLMKDQAPLRVEAWVSLVESDADNIAS